MYYYRIKVPSGCTTELSHRGQQFLTQLFERHDKDKDSALNTAELRNVFSCCPQVPWHHLRQTVPTNEKVQLLSFRFEIEYLRLYYTY